MVFENPLLLHSSVAVALIAAFFVVVAIFSFPHIYGWLARAVSYY